MILKIKNWIKETDTFEVMAIVAIILGAIVIGLSFLLGSLNDISLTGKHADVVDLSEYIGTLVGSLWSLAGVLLFYASLSSQKEDLERQKELLVKQIDEVVAQTKEFRIQNEMARDQKNEETFFQLLRFHNEILSTITIEQQEVDFVSGANISKTVEGRKSFVEYYDIFKRFFQEASELNFNQDEDGISKIFDKSYNSFYLEYQADLGHYFRNLYNIIFFIDTLKTSQQSFYLGLLMAQLSNYELTLLFFHCLRSTNKEFKTLVEKYAILEQVPKDEVTTMAYKIYSPSAFGESGFGSGDIIEEEIEDESEYTSSFDTDGLLSKLNLHDLNNENDGDNSVESGASSDSTMDSILSKLKNLTTEKFPNFVELDNLHDSNDDYENPLKKLKDKNAPETKISDKVKNDDYESAFSLEDFFDDSGDEQVYNEDDAIIDSDQIIRMESKILELEGTLKESPENDEFIESNKSGEINEPLDISSDFADLWGEKDSINENDDDSNPGLNDIKNSLISSNDDEFESLRSSISDSDTDYNSLKNLIDSDLDADSMLFNKDADLKNEGSIFDESPINDDLDSIKNKFNVNFEESENNEILDLDDNSISDDLDSIKNKFNVNFDNSDIIDGMNISNFDENIDKVEGNISDEVENLDENSSISESKKLNIKVNSKKNNKGGKGFLSKLN